MVFANIIPLCQVIFDAVITVSWHCYCSLTKKKSKKIILIPAENFVKLPNRKFPLRKQIKCQIILLPNSWLMKRHLLCWSSLFLLTGIHILYFKFSFHMVNISWQLLLQSSSFTWSKEILRYSNHNTPSSFQNKEE